MKSKLKVGYFFSKVLKSSPFAIALLLCFTTSCKKDLVGGPPVKSADLIAAINVLKVHATAQEYNDMDFNSVKATSMPDKSILLKIKSKSDPSKMLIYNTKNGITHARWINFKATTLQSTDNVTVSSVNETHIIISSFKNGKVYAKKFINNGVTQSSILPASTITSQAIVASSKFSAKTLDDDDCDTSFDGGDDDNNPCEVTSTIGSDDNGSGGGNTGNSGVTTTNADGSTTTTYADGSTSTINTDGSVTTTGPIAYNIDIQGEVTVNGNTSIDPNNTLNLYSLFILFGYDSIYLNQYTTNPNDPNATTVNTSGPAVRYGVDPNFVKNQTSTQISIRPTFLMSTYNVTISYTLTTVNGVPTVNVSSITADMSGNLMFVGWVAPPVIQPYSITGSSIINFNVTGLETYGVQYGGVGPSLWGSHVQLQGSYDTSNGAFFISKSDKP